jgi:DHA1 family tetracycline resistance protein-like MFS transporter
MTTPSAAQPVEDRRALFTLLAVVYINIAGFGVLIPLLPFYGKSFHVSPAQVALLFAAYSFGNIFAEPFWGKMSDRIGRRPVLLLTIFGSAMAYLSLAFCHDFWLACAIRMLGGVLAGNISTIQGYIADITPPERRAARLGFLGAAFGLGFITGPWIGGMLARPELGTLGFRPPFLASMAFCLAAGVCVALFVRESRVHKHSDAPPQGRFAQIGAAARHPIISRTIAVNFIAVAAFSGVESIFGIWVGPRYGWGPLQVGWCFGGMGIVAVLIQSVITGRLARRFGEGTVLTLGLLLLAAGLAAQPFAHHWPSAVINMLLVVLGQSLAFPNVAAMISHSTAPDRQGAMLGLNLAGGALARVIGPLIAGPLFVALGPSSPFISSALITLPGVFLAWRARAAARRAHIGA